MAKLQQERETFFDEDTTSPDRRTERLDAQTVSRVSRKRKADESQRLGENDAAAAAADGCTKKRREKTGGGKNRQQQKNLSTKQKTESVDVLQEEPHVECLLNGEGGGGDDDDGRSVASSGSTSVTVARKKKANNTASSALNRLLDMEDKAPLCVLGETESNVFPRKLWFMNQPVDVMYDSRVHLWLKADDVAKALGYKNYKSAVERHVHPTFVRSFPEVLDMSRSRYGDAFRLYSVNSKVMFVNEAGFLQLLLRSMICDDGGGATKEKTGQKTYDPATENKDGRGKENATANRLSKQHTKAKLSADWINYQIQPSLLAFSEAARSGMTAKDERNSSITDGLYVGGFKRF